VGVPALPGRDLLDQPAAEFLPLEPLLLDDADGDAERSRLPGSSNTSSPFDRGGASAPVMEVTSV
jgi:hypothetical protein